MSALPIIAKPYPLVKGGNDISRSLVSRKAQNNVTLLGGRSSDRSSHEPGLPYGAYARGSRDGAPSKRKGNTRLGDLATPPADSSESSRKQHEARGLCHSAGRQLRELEKQHEARGLCHPAGRQLRELEKATRGSGTLPLRRPTAQRARESNTRLGDFATSPADSSESSRKQHEARGLCHSAGRQLRELENTAQIAKIYPATI
ncbi:hypothetical protein PUN28_020660 [Cardiocondyla obscurior]|uniref:Uncharacterized protein n=1 Tax=Cardiocondyla obscurior TaxID=286306 RepID=A0AAW2E8J3_9HYME